MEVGFWKGLLGQEGCISRISAKRGRILRK